MHARKAFLWAMFLALWVAGILGAGQPGCADTGDPDWLFVSPQERQLVEKAQRLSYLSELDEASSVAQEAVSVFPNGTESQLCRIKLAEKMHQLDKVIPFYREWATLETTNPVAQFCLGLCYYLIQNSTAAADQLKLALALRPDYVRAQYYLIEVDVSPRDSSERRRQRREKTTRIRERIQRLRNHHPDYAPALMLELRFLRDYLGYDRGAMPYGQLRQVVRQMREFPVPLPEAFTLQDAFRENDPWRDPLNSVPLYDRALKIAPWRADLAISRADHLLSGGETTQALNALLALVRTAPRNYEARLKAAAILADLHRYDEALSILRDGIGRVKYAELYEAMALSLAVSYLYRSQQFDETTSLCRQIIHDHPEWGASARTALARLAMRMPHDRIRVLDNVPYLVQKHKFCGPASVSMLLGYWGVRKTQDDIGHVIYTGITGEPPEAIVEYVRELGFRSATFEGGVPVWKRLIDAGIPVLWMQLDEPMPGQGHYVVITGYDDIAKEIIVHNPWYATETRVSYALLDDYWPLPTLHSSIAVVPSSDARVSLLDGLHPTLRLRVVDMILYALTGSNLHPSLFSGLLINMLLAAVSIALLVLLMRALTCPPRGYWGLFALAIVAALVLNLAIAFGKVGVAVSLQIASAMALPVLYVLLAIGIAKRRLLHDWFPPRCVLALVVTVLGVFWSLAVVDDELWRYRVPWTIAVAGLLYILFTYWRVVLIVRSARLAPVIDPAVILDKVRDSYSGSMALIEHSLASGDHTRAAQLLQELRSRNAHWPRAYRDTLDLLAATASLPDVSSPASQSDANTAAPSAAHAAVATLDALSARWNPRSAIGLASRVLLALASRSHPEPAQSDRDQQLLASARDAVQLLIRRGRWPHLPATPRFAFGGRPHWVLTLARRMMDGNASTS